MTHLSILNKDGIKTVRKSVTISPETVFLKKKLYNHVIKTTHLSVFC